MTPASSREECTFHMRGLAGVQAPRDPVRQRHGPVLDGQQHEPGQHPRVAVWLDHPRLPRACRPEAGTSHLSRGCLLNMVTALPWQGVELTRVGWRAQAALAEDHEEAARHALFSLRGDRSVYLPAPCHAHVSSPHALFEQRAGPLRFLTPRWLLFLSAHSPGEGTPALYSRFMACSSVC